MRNEKLKQSSIEYLNRTIPKNAQSGTIIRGDYYGETDDSSIEDAQYLPQKYIEDVCNDFGNIFQQKIQKTPCF